MNKQHIIELRERTGQGMIACRDALRASDGDVDQAVEYLRAHGLSTSSLSERAALEGRVVSYVHPNGRVGVLLEVNCETDFTAATDEFRAFCHDVALHIAAMSPLSVVDCLDEVFIKDEKTTIRQLLEALTGKVRENIQIRRFVRYALSAE